MNMSRLRVLPKICIQLKDGSVARSIRIFVLAMMIVSPTTALSVVQCSTPDHSFKEFLQRFEESIEFQRSRIVLPMVTRFGDYTMTNVVIELWSSEKLKKLDYPLILSLHGRKKEHVMESIVLSTKRYAEVFHDGPPESDLYRVLYKFRNIDGCWFLEEMHDKSK